MISSVGFMGNSSAYLQSILTPTNTVQPDLCLVKCRTYKDLTIIAFAPFLRPFDIL